MKFLLKRDRIKTRWKYGAGRTWFPGAPITLDSYSTVISTFGVIREERRREKMGEKSQESNVVATRESRACDHVTLQWLHSDREMRGRIYYACTPAYITVIHIKTTRTYIHVYKHIHIHILVSRWLLLLTNSAAFRNNKKARMYDDSFAYVWTRKLQSIFIISKCLVIDGKFYKK